MQRYLRLLGLAAGLAQASSPAIADGPAAPYGDSDFADVVHVEPVRRQVRVSEPVRECWQESSRASQGPFSYSHIGGAIGHNVLVDRQRQQGANTLPTCRTTRANASASAST
jgi:hypothetical protein